MINHVFIAMLSALPSERRKKKEEHRPYVWIGSVASAEHIDSARLFSLVPSYLTRRNRGVASKLDLSTCYRRLKYSQPRSDSAPTLFAPSLPTLFLRITLPAIFHCSWLITFFPLPLRPFVIEFLHIWDRRWFAFFNISLTLNFHFTECSIVFHLTDRYITHNNR